MKNKQCRKCKLNKPISEFFKNKSQKDGLSTQCKMCDLVAMKNYATSRKGKETKKRANKKYNVSEKGRATGIRGSTKYNRSQKGQQKNREWQNEYSKTEKGKEVRKKAIETYRIKHPDARRAGIAVNNAVTSGTLPRVSTQICGDCKNQAEHYHHESYKEDNWLDVIPLCTPCHGKRHRKSN